jgi:glycosyltransferase involved in cell wall biosynthesis
VAVNTRFLLKDELEGCGYFIKEIFQLLVKAHPEHRFYFLFDRPYAAEFIFSSNVQPVVISPPARHPLLWKYWFDIKVPQVLRKIRADVFVSADGYCSLTTRVPQCLVLHDLGFLHYPEAYKKTHAAFLKRNMPRFLQKARGIATVSQFSKNDIADTYKIDPETIGRVYNGVRDLFQPVPLQRQAEVKEKYTGGKEYFIYVGAIHPRKNLVNLLKAFSVFKKRQQSNMKLVLAGRLAWKNDAFLELLKTYRYKSDVVMTGYLKEEALALVLGSAYALVYPSLFEGFGVPVAEAMRCGVPVLTSEKTSMEEVAGEAGLYFDPNDHRDMAEKMMLIYKDETLRGQLIANGRSVSGKYDWEQAAALLWKIIVKTAAAGK